MTEKDKELNELRRENQELRKEVKKWRECHERDTQELLRKQRQIDILMGHDPV